MAHALQQLLGNSEPLFSSSLNQLEKTTGKSGVDVRLLADMTHKAHGIMRQIGLDPADTTAYELLNSLEALVKNGRAQQLLLDADYVLLRIGSGMVSFNLIDVIENAHHELKLDRATVAHGQRALRGAILERYLSHDRTDDTVTTELATTSGILIADDKAYPQASRMVTDAQTPYILAVGDIFSDAFIKLREDQARIDTDPDGSKRLSMPFGSKPPYDSVEIVQAVGPSPNAAVSMQRLGVQTSLLAFLGDDQPGEDSIDYLKQEGVDTSMLSVQKDTKSNYYYVLRYGADRTILVKNEEYDYAWRIPTVQPDWIYLSLLSADSWQLHEDLLEYLEENPSIKLAFQPGTFHFEWGTEKLAGIYQRSYIVVMNREEAVEVTGKSYDSIQELADGLHALGPEVVVITDGPDGSYASYDDTLITMPNYPDPAPPLDRTGAGDAFASTIVAALAQGETIETALAWAPINSMNVVQKLGAQAGLLRKDDIKQYLKNAPDDYRQKEL